MRRHLRFLWRGLLPAVVLCVSGIATGSDEDIPALTLPWSFAVEETGIGADPFLPAATEVGRSVLRTLGPVDEHGSTLRLEYRRASYPDKGAARQDFDRLPDGIESGQWHVVLLAKDSLYWLSAGCPLAGDGLSRVYADLIAGIERDGPAVNYALLCACDSACRRVAVDR